MKNDKQVIIRMPSETVELLKKYALKAGYGVSYIDVIRTLIEKKLLEDLNNQTPNG